MLILGVSGPELTAADASLYRDLQPGGFVLSTRNLVDAVQTRNLTDDLRDLCEHEPLLCLDNDGGRSWSSIAATPPSPADFRGATDPTLIPRHGWATGRLLRLLGLNMNLAPVLDIDPHPGTASAPRNECWGSTDQEVINRAGQFNRYQRRQGILACGRNFPAGGRARADRRHDFPVIGSTIGELLGSDLLPYTALMPELDALMPGHLHFPEIDSEGLPASLSTNIIQRLLRDQLGFDHHLVLTDDLDNAVIRNRYGTPAAARMAIVAGADLVLLCHHFTRAAESLESLATLPPPTLDDTLRRIERNRKRLHPPLPFSTTALDEVNATFTDL